MGRWRSKGWIVNDDRLVVRRQGAGQSSRQLEKLILQGMKMNMQPTGVITIRALIGLCACLIMTNVNAVENPYWDFSIYGTQNPQKLMQISIDSESTAEKLRIRSYLAQKHGNSMEGFAAQAWMAGYEGRAEESKKLYLECTHRYPKFGLCINNVVNANQNDLVLAQMFLDADPTAFDFSPIRTMFSNLGEAGKVQEQKAFLKSVEQKYAGSWLIPYLYYMEAAQRKDPVAQRAALYQAISTAGQKPPFVVYQLLINLEIGQFYQGGESRLTKAIELVVQYFKQTERYDEYEPWRFLLAEVADNSEATRVALLQQYERFLLVSKIKSADSAHPMPVEILDLVNWQGEAANHSQLGPWLRSLREKFAARRSSEPEIEKRLLSFETSSQEISPKDLAPRWQKLISNALSEKDAAAYAVKAIWDLVQADGCNEAQSLAETWGTRFGENADFHSNAYEAALCVNDFAKARQHLDAARRINPKGYGITARTDRMRLAMAEDRKQQWDKEQARNPLYKLWDAKNGARVSLNIEFATGLSSLPAKYFGQLNQLAKLLKENGAEEYQFDIGGHTDSRGSAPLNQKLSEERAKAVVDYLVAKAGIDRARLVATGYGSSLPLADNNGEEGLRKNRRVEILPRASLRTPILAKQGKPDGSVTMSPDGRYLATYEGLWDVRSRIKVRTFPAASYYHRMAFAPNGRILVRVVSTEWPNSSERVIELIDTSSGLVMKRKKGGIEGFDISPDGSRLAVVKGGMLVVLGMPDLQVVAQRRLSPADTSGMVAWLGNGKLVASVRSGGEKLHLLNASDLKITKVFDDINYVHTLDVSRTGKTLAVITNDGMLHTWDTQSWRHRELQLGVFAEQFVFHPFEEKALIGQWNGTERKTRLLDLGAMKVIKTWGAGDGVQQPAFSVDGRSFFFAGKEYDFATLNSRPWSEHKEGLGEGGYFSSALPDRGQFLTYSNYTSIDDTQIWDLASGHPADKLVGLKMCGSVDGSPGYFWRCTKESEYQEMVEKGSWRIVPAPSPFKTIERQYIKNRTASRLVVFEQDAPPSSGREAKNGNLLIIDRISGKLLASHPVLLRLEDALYSNDDALHYGNVSTSIDPSGRYLAMRVSWKEHWGYPELSGKVVWLFDLETGKEIERLSLKGRAEKISFMPGNAAKLRVGFDTKTEVYDVSKRGWGENEPWTSKETLHDENGTLKVLANKNILTLLDNDQPERYVFARKNPETVKLFPAQNLMLVYYGGGEYDYYDLKMLNLQLSMHMREKGEWLAYTPSGEFSASPNGAQGYYWALGDKYLPFDALKERFERPDVIKQQLGKVVSGTATAPQQLMASSLSQNAASAQNANPVVPQLVQQPNTNAAPAGGATAPTIEADLFMPPFKLRLIDPPAKSHDAQIGLRVGITKVRAIASEPEIELNINGQQVKSRGLRVTSGKTCVDAKGQGTIDCEQTVEIPVSLGDGRNVVQVSLLYRNARLDTATTVVELERPRSVGQQAPRLWLFAAGVSKYADGKQNLQFADRDAEELAKVLKAQEGKLFSQVNTKVFTNQMVTKGTLDTEIKRFLKQASEQDMIIILLAGHGVQDNDQTLYFMTHDAVMDEPYSGLDVSQIRVILRNRPMNQKALLLLDICHAGALGEGKRGQVSAEDAIKQLSQGTGVIVLSSSTGRELSNEGANFRGGHGAFTSAVLDGLEGAADRDAGNRDGVVSISELTTFVMRRVPELTRNSQHPTMPSTERVQDFPVAVGS